MIEQHISSKPFASLNSSFPAIQQLPNSLSFNPLQMELPQNITKQQTEKDMYETNRHKNQRLDQWLKQQEHIDNIKDYLDVEKKFPKITNNSDDNKNKNILPQNHIKTIKNNYNIYINYPTESSSKITLHKSDLWSRRYEVQTGKTPVSVSLCIVNMKLGELSRLVPQQAAKLKGRQILQQILYLNKNENLLEIVKVNDNYFQSLKDIITNVASLKSNPTNNSNNNSHNNSHINSTPFLFDILLFQNYAVYLTNKIQPISSKLNQQTKTSVTQLSNDLQQILKFRFLIYEKKFQKVSQWYDGLETGKLKNSLKKLILNEIKQMQDFKSDQDQGSSILASMGLVQDTEQTLNILSKAFEWKDQTQQYINVIESLNRINYDFLSKQSIQTLYKIVFNKNPQTFGFEIRLSRTIVQKYTTTDEIYFINKRSIMLFFVQHYYEAKNVQKLQELLDYFMCISDFANIQSLQNKILELTPPQQYCLKNLEFYLCKKTLTVSFDTFLHNKYSQNIKNYQQYPQSPNLQKQKQITLNIMYQITKSMFDKSFQDIVDSPHSQNYKQLVTTLPNSIQYSDVLVMLDQIYNFNLFSFDRFVQKSWQRDLSEFGPISQPYKATNPNFHYLIKRPFILHNVLKDYFYFKLFSASSSVLLLDDLRKIIKNLPIVARFGSLFWVGLCLATGEQSCAKQIINDHYLKIQKQTNNFSPDLISLLQISVKYNLTDPKFEQLRFQMLLRGIQIFIDIHYNLLNTQFPQQKTFLIKALNQLMYPTMRDSIATMKMAPLRKKVLDKIQQVYKSQYKLYSEFNVQISPQTQQMAYQIKIFLLTQNMCQDKKKQSVSIFVDLYQKFPLKINLYFYYVKIKNHMNLQSKKITRKTMQINLHKILQRNQPKHYKFLQNKLKVKAIFGQLCLMSPIEALHLQFMFKFTKKVYRIFEDKLPNQMKFIINQAMYEFHQIVQGSTITDPQYTQGFVNKIMSAFTQEKTIESQKSRQDLAKCLLIDPFISFAILQAIKYPQFDNLTIKDYKNIFSALYKVRNSKLFKNPKFLSAYQNYLKLKISLKQNIQKSQKFLKRTLIKNSRQHQKTTKGQYQIQIKQWEQSISEIKKKKRNQMNPQEISKLDNLNEKKKIWKKICNKIQNYTTNIQIVQNDKKKKKQ